MEGHSSTREPRWTSMHWNYLGKIIRLWRVYGLSETHSMKMLRLWVGYEFQDLMDEYGRYPLTSYNEIRHRLHYTTWKKMMADVQRCQSFGLLGSDPNRPTSFFSTMWHEYSPVADGVLLNIANRCAMYQDMSQEIMQKVDGNNKYNIINTTVGNGEVVERSYEDRKNIVVGYWQWVVMQKDQDHQDLVENLRNRLCHPCDRMGHVIVGEELTEEETDRAWDVLVHRVFVPYFSAREDFFKQDYLDHPRKRVYWMKNLMKKQGKCFVKDALKHLRCRRQELEVEEVRRTLKRQRENRPISPYEWMDNDDVRWYTLNGVDTRITANAKPRPSDTATYNFFTKEWLEG